MWRNLRQKSHFYGYQEMIDPQRISCQPFFKEELLRDNHSWLMTGDRLWIVDWRLPLDCLLLTLDWWLLIDDWRCVISRLLDGDLLSRRLKSAATSCVYNLVYGLKSSFQKATRFEFLFDYLPGYKVLCPITASDRPHPDLWHKFFSRLFLQVLQ